MGKKILMYKGNIIFIVVILAVLWLYITFYSGVKEGYSDIFFAAIILSPALSILIPKNNIKIDIIFAIVIVLILALFAVLFWMYKDGTLFSSIDVSQISEGVRYRFSFENRLRLDLLLIFGSISTLISLLIRIFYLKFNVVKNNSLHKLMK
ncbi:MAG: hypothetical protein CVU97_01115 [Firmicutes bacterium HGW-Firmicutes-21]|nr:MAG: hypothetical protein CVU97_01115 [Firmicutes bacterium HGW-Firmicutes-21]